MWSTSKEQTRKKSAVIVVDESDADVVVDVDGRLEQPMARRLIINC